MQLYILLPGVFSSGLVLVEAVAIDEGVFGWPLFNFLKLPTLNLMTTHIIIMLTTRMTAITTSPISDTTRGTSMLPNEGYVGGMLAAIIDVVSAEPGVLSIVVILHSSMKLYSVPGTVQLNLAVKWRFSEYSSVCINV